MGAAEERMVVLSQDDDGARIMVTHSSEPNPAEGLFFQVEPQGHMPVIVSADDVEAFAGLLVEAVRHYRGSRPTNPPRDGAE